ncbi:MAG: hypothetical protein OEW29_19190 [Acidimicrobiia bacterium]|nr:hypothetical protein [Acidimicrobiia bacterium]MDH4366136.1 hypothetical protein [Acidimicrobiia bacterium]
MSRPAVTTTATAAFVSQAALDGRADPVAVPVRLLRIIRQMALATRHRARETTHDPHRQGRRLVCMSERSGLLAYSARR